MKPAAGRAKRGGSRLRSLRPLVPLLVALLALPTPAALPLGNDDAGSGRDAPDVRTGPAVVVAPGVVYEGNLSGPLHGRSGLGDLADLYTIAVDGTLRLDARAAGSGVACLYLYRGGTIVASNCGEAYAEEARFSATVTPGTYHLAYSFAQPQTYRFSFALDGVAPPLGVLPELVPEPAPAPRPSAPSEGPSAHNAVIALIDDGINPYHLAFRDPSPRAVQHPSTYLAGYPADAEAIAITFGHTSLLDALRADCAEWAKVVPGKLYWFPGTRVIGGIAFREAAVAGVLPASQGPVTCADPQPKEFGNIVGSGGHGTMTGSRAAGAEYGACPDCLVVMVQGFSAQSVRWPADQPWIDVQSNSWGPIVPGHAPVGTGLLVSDPGLARAVEESARKQPAFWAAGNGAAFRAGALGHPTQAAPHLGPSAIRVGGTDSGYVETWSGSSPHVVSDVCDSWAAVHSSLTGSEGTVGSGTSAATPFVAGTAARVVREARALMGDPVTGVRAGGVLATGAPVGGAALADGTLTTDELLAALYRTADARPDGTPEDAGPCRGTILYDATPVPWSAVPEGPHGIPIVGYGAVTRATGDEALDVLAGARAMPERVVEDAFFLADRALREALYLAYSAS